MPRKTKNRYKGLGHKIAKKAKIEAVVALPNVVEDADVLSEDEDIYLVLAKPYVPENDESIHKACAERTVDPVIGRRMAMAYFYCHIDHAPTKCYALSSSPASGLCQWFDNGQWQQPAASWPHFSRRLLRQVRRMDT